MMDDGLAGALLALKERKREMDDLWLLTIVVLIFAVGVLWFQRILDIELAGILWTALIYGSAYVAIGLLADRVSTPAMFLTSVAALQVAGVATLTILWRLSGGLQNPMFLLAFVLPIVTGSALMPRWQLYGTAALTVTAVTAVAFIDNAALRWYLWQFELPIGGALDWLGQFPETTVRPFPSVDESPPYQVAITFLFGVMMFAVAAVADSLGRTTARLESRSSALTSALTNVESLSAQALHQLPVPTALIYADTFRLVAASESFFHQHLIDPDDTRPRGFFDVVRFSYPEAVEELITGRGGELPLATVVVHGEKRFVRVRVSHATHAKTRYACVVMHDETDTHYRRLALDALETPTITVADGRIAAFNAAAASVVDRLVPGADVDGPLRAANLPFAWWSLGERSREEFDVQLGDRIFRATCRTARVEGEPEPVTVITLHQPKGATP